MKEKWIEVSIALPGELAAIWEAQLSGLGSVGNAEYIRDEDNKTDEAATVVKGYFGGNAGSVAGKVDSLKAFASSLKALFPSANISDVETKETWEDEWQEWRRFFKPILVSDRVVIKPTWEEYARKGEEVVFEIDPGMAFGTGTHETTRLCIQLLDRIIGGGEAVFDVGTGSGILAIAAAGLGAGKVLGIDNDDEAVRVAVENVELNSCRGSVSISGAALAEVDDLFDIVVANILAEDLVEMRKALTARTAEGGRVILSGILSTKAGMVIDAYMEEGATLEEHLEEGEWSALMLKK